ncbi:MAG: SBBP repeat-containing protein [Flavobacteriales bacterium]|nr:SBBP repeat-containing protein [Flavobacteriales bacterium]
MEQQLRPVSFLVAWILAAGPLCAQVPDFFGDTVGNAWYTLNAGQLLNDDGSVNEDVIAYTGGTLPRVYVQTGTRSRFVLAQRDTSASTPDTLRSVELALVGESANEEPIIGHAAELPWVQNFYFPWCTSATTGLHPKGRIIKKEVYPKIDQHFYGGRSGPKMAFVCQPGSEPGQIILQFTGQDSLNVDWQGALRMYFGEKFLRLEEAIAFQVDGQGTIVPVYWSAEYEHVQGSTQVTFDFGPYDIHLPLIFQIGPPPLGAWEPTDPRNLGWSTYVGGNDADELTAADVDEDGNAYVCGYAYESHFPIGTGTQFYPPAFDNLMGGEDAVVMKFEGSTKRILWATYLGGGAAGGGAADLDKAYDLAVYRGPDTDKDYVFVTGSTVSLNFPLQAWPGSAFANADTDPVQVWSKPNAYLSAFRKLDGRMDWSTTHGAPLGDVWLAEGMAVDVDADGIVAWGGRLSETPLDPLQYDYPYVTPSGAFSKPVGGGFFTLFNSAYQAEWRTPFGSMGEITGLADLRLLNTTQGRYAYLTGTTAGLADPALFPLDVVDLPGTADFYQGTPGGGQRDAYVDRLNLDAYQIEWCTYWGGNGRELGLALEVMSSEAFGTFIWVGGTTRSTNLTAAQLPAGGPIALHQDVPGGQGDGYLLKFGHGNSALLWGSLYGGEGPDAVLDLEVDPACNAGGTGCRLYATGETGSATGIWHAGAGTLYDQPLLGTFGGDRRDAFVLAVNGATQEPIWTTYWGGIHADRGWGVAASVTELYLAGGAISDQLSFPLREFDPLSPLDWYDGDLTNNLGGGYGWISTNNTHYYNPIDDFFATDPHPGHSHDGFICSFGLSPNLSVSETAPEDQAPWLIPLEPGRWQVRLPQGHAGRLELWDARGRLVQMVARAQDGNVVDLADRAPGVYLARLVEVSGAVRSVKALR